MKRVVFSCTLAALLVLLSGCIVINPKETPSPAASASQSTVAPVMEKSATPVVETPTPAPTATPDPKQALLDRSALVLKALQTNDFTSLAEYAHPQKGVRFSPYAMVSDQDVVLKSEEIKNLGADTKKYHWGLYDGSGEPIDLTYADYEQIFVNDADFPNAPKISVDERLGQGNSIDNSKEFYPNATVVEYHFAGFDEQYQGMDWKSLRLVFEQQGNVFYLVGVIHDQWTI